MKYDIKDRPPPEPTEVVFWIKARMGISVDPKHGIPRIVALADQINCGVDCKTYSGVRILCSPGTDPAELISRFEEELRSESKRRIATVVPTRRAALSSHKGGE